MGMLFAGGRELYENVEKKRGILDAYLEKCAHNLSGQTMIVKAEQICSNLEEKADWLMEHIRMQEWIAEDEARGWFNGYYDDHKNPVEGTDDADESGFCDYERHGNTGSDPQNLPECR